jgi:hypothetical protein
MVAEFAQANIDSEHGSVDVNALIGKLRFGQVEIGDMHPIQASRDRIPRIEIVPDPTAHVHCEGEVLPLGV